MDITKIVDCIKNIPLTERILAIQIVTISIEDDIPVIHKYVWINNDLIKTGEVTK